jgi:hypothetical protein
MNSHDEENEWPSAYQSKQEGQTEADDVGSPTNSNITLTDEESSPSPDKYADDSPIPVPEPIDLPRASRESKQWQSGAP